VALQRAEDQITQLMCQLRSLVDLPVALDRRALVARGNATVDLGSVGFQQPTAKKIYLFRVENTWNFKQHE